MANGFSDRTLAALNDLKAAIETSRRIVVLTGAGASVPSGIPDFRSAHGLYSTPFGNYPAETVISHDFFISHTKEFYDFYKSKMLVILRLMLLLVKNIYMKRIKLMLI